MPDPSQQTEQDAPAAGGFGGPLRQPLFRSMWVAQFLSNTGGWMQTVGAQWLMLSLTTSTVALALIQTAASLPVLLFALLAGALGDLVDRRRLLLASTGFMLIAAAILGGLAIAGVVTPFSLLALLFLVGIGQALTSPTWQSLQPELVPAADRPQAIALGAVNQNLARAVGPAIGGVLVAATEPSVVFLVNAATFLAVIVVVARWRGSKAALVSTLPPEHVGAAMRASGRYVRNSPALRTVLLRSGAFVFFASAIWALLPAVASKQLGMSSGGYGLLLGCVGVGAVVGAAVLPVLRGRLSPDRLLAIGAAGVALSAVILAEVHSAVAVGATLAVAGLAWILSLATLNAGYQSMLPGWIKARGMGVYLIVFQGGNAIGSAAFGFLAGGAGLDVALLIAAAGLAAGPFLALWRPFPVIRPAELLPAEDHPALTIAPSGPAGTGPVMVSIEYHPAPSDEDELLTVLHGVRAARRRTGAIRWQAWVSAEPPRRVVEQFVVASWDEHQRQHERVTHRDAERLARAAALSQDVPVVTHWLTPEPGGA